MYADISIRKTSPAVSMPRAAVLLINLGTPDAPTAREVHRYLAEFLSDPRVIEMPQWLWQPILRGLVLPFRSHAAARRYESIWMPDGSPLRVHTEQQATALRRWLTERGQQVRVAYAMRYGTPSIAGELDRLIRQGCDRIVILPMYPQYAASTTATAFDKVASAFAQIRNQPEVRFIKQYFADSRYISALADTVRRHWYVHGRPDFNRGDQMLLSFHGLPQRAIERGDPYHAQCLETGALLAEALSLDAHHCRVTFQSEFGRQEWIGPHTAETLAELGASGTHRVDVFCPGFTADCIETVDEIGVEGRDTFLKWGGREFHRIDCVNASAPFIDALGELTLDQLKHWSGVVTQSRRKEEVTISDMGAASCLTL
ncbi:ferrochelatase [Paraburkholderia sp. NPDC080076]|uniref:ferrochelatase n=1 Tax=Paraburkholderia sp. NPDC080076 TaxID=3390605 RepID=UPI003D05885A